MVDDQAFEGTMLILVTITFVLPFVIAFSTYRHIVPLYYFQAPYLVSVALRSSLFQKAAWRARLDRLCRPIVLEANRQT